MITILPCCATLLGHQKTRLFHIQRRCKSRTERSDIACTTSQANEQTKDLIVGVTSLKLWIIIQSCLNLFPNYLPRWIKRNAHLMCIGFKLDSFEYSSWIGCAFDAHRGVHVNGPLGCLGPAEDLGMNDLVAPVWLWWLNKRMRKLHWSSTG